MPRDTLIDVFTDLAATRGEFLVYDDGFRSVSRSYEDVGRAARALAARLAAEGVGRGDRIILWGENRPEWVAALWAAIISGIVVVPIDYRSSLDFVRRIRAIVEARVILAGEDVPAEAMTGVHGAGRLDGAAVWRLAGIDWRADGPMPAVQVSATDTAEIIFTSGATAEPKGVVLTHRNILANTVPIEQEVHKYRKYGRPFFPLRFLNLLPLSHMFGQAMATFIPPMLPGTTVFVRSLSPHDIVRQIRERRVSVLVSVPKLLDVLRGHVQHTAPTAAAPAGAGVHWVRRWWLHRDVHRAFGMKFWAFVVGAAPLDPDLETYWSRLGFAVIQGYGLTETAPVVTVNHPFAMRRGSVGKPIHGLKVKVAADGEILVRGDNVTQGYYNAPAATAEAFEDGWLRTGDIGEVDESGRLYVRGRKKEMIVSPDGFNVFPDDVERVLDGVAGVRESAVVGLTDGASERVHAVLVVDPGADLDEIVRAANAKLADHQRVRTAAAWPGTSPAADGGHPQAEAGRDRALGPERGRGKRDRAGRRPHRGGPGAPVARPERGCFNQHRGARAQLARSSRADGGARAAAADVVRRVGVRTGQDRRRPARAGGWERGGSRRGAGRQAGGAPMEPLLAGPGRPARPAVRARASPHAPFRPHHGARNRAPARSDGSGRAGLQPSEPHGHAGDPRGAAAGTSAPRGSRDGQGVLSGPISIRRNTRGESAQRPRRCIFWRLWCSTPSRSPSGKRAPETRSATSAT